MLAEAVAAGCITQDQADLMLKHLAEEVAGRMNEPFSPSGVCGQGSGGYGRRGGSRWATGSRS